MEENSFSFYWRDIITPDNSMSELVEALNKAGASFKDFADLTAANAANIAASLKTISSAAAEGRASIETAAEAANRLTKVGASADEMKKAMRDALVVWNSLNKEERDGTALGKDLAATIKQLSSEIQAVTAVLKPGPNLVLELARAEEKLNSMQTELGKKIIEIKDKTASLNNEHARRRREAESLVIAEEKLKFAQSDEARQLVSLNLETQKANKLNKLQAQLSNSAEGSYDRLAVQYAINTMRLNEMSREMRESSDEGKKLVEETKAIRASMVAMDEGIGNHSLSVGNYKEAWGGLGFSISQVVRELPAAAVNLNTFFLGISNNIPMVVDQIQKLRLQNEQLKKEGKETINIGKQILTSIVSWNTLLVVVLTLFSMFGDKITAFITSLFKSKGAIISVTKATKNLNKELEKNNGNYGDNIVTIKRLSREWKSLKSTAEKQQWIKDNTSEFNRLGIAVSGVTDAEKAFANNTKNVVDALELRAKATAASSLASEQYEKAFIEKAKILARLQSEKGTLAEAQVKYEALTPEQLAEGMEVYNAMVNNPNAYYDTYNQLRSIFNENAKIVSSYLTAKKNVESLEEAAKSAGKTFEETGDLYFGMAEDFNQRADDLLKGTGLYLKEGSNNLKDFSKQIDDMLLRVRKKYDESMTALERDTFEKRKKQTIDTANEEIQELENIYRNNQRILENTDGKRKELTEQQLSDMEIAQEQIKTAIEAKQMQLSYDLEQIELDRQDKELEILEQTIKLRLQAVEKGSAEEARLRLAAVNIQGQRSLIQNQKLPAGQRQNPSDIKAAANKTQLGEMANLALEGLDRVQAYKAAEFNIVKHTARQSKEFQLEQERKRISLQIYLAEHGALDWSKAQIDAAKATVVGISVEIKKLKNIIDVVAEEGLGTGILDLLGFNDEQIKALEDSFDIVLDCINDILQANIDLAEAEVEAADKRVEAAQKVLDAEIEARDAGYANKVATAQKELELEKRNKAEQEKLLKKAQRRQEAINTVTQSSSLITASAELWSAFGSIPYVGPALAIAAIATMWTSFATAKSKAKQVAEKSQEYGEGGFEILEGGSHASGNDIDLHTKNKKGNNMRAEGGEGLAIINKRSTAKYRAKLPGIIKSINNGTFEDKYLKVFESGAKIQACLTAVNSNVDLSRIESGVDAMRKQNSISQSVLPDGTIIMRKANCTRIIHRC